MKRRILVLLAAGALLAGCADANQDRSGGGGKDPDEFAEATHVRVYTNADRVPNIAVFCIGDLAFATGLNQDRATATILRLPEWDAQHCGGAAR